MRNKVVALLFVAAMGLALVAGIVTPRAGRSVLPEFDSAKFTSHGPGGRSVVELKGAVAQRLRSVFERIPRERDPKKWIAFGHLSLMKSGNEVLQIDVLSGPKGEGPFGIEGEGSYLGYDEPAFRALLTEAGWVPDPAR